MPRSAPRPAPATAAAVAALRVALAALLARPALSHGQITWPPSTRHGGNVHLGADCARGECFWFSNNVEVPGPSTIPPALRSIVGHMLLDAPMHTLLARHRMPPTQETSVQIIYNAKYRYRSEVASGEQYLRGPYSVEPEVEGGKYDVHRASPWRAPGTAAVYGSGCGIAGGHPTVGTDG